MGIQGKYEIWEEREKVSAEFKEIKSYKELISAKDFKTAYNFSLLRFRISAVADFYINRRLPLFATLDHILLRYCPPTS
ncbi:hypothetical protein DPV73_10985 [Leptospira mayottensis]|nr:hypothetical protein DPV73_10985 [Leptospira mayottensis]